ncbi:MAG: hypothetical protein U9O24_03360 [Campylobacterota bacterium]|nr:hypothetical protein [Campylobacterota bacterium]
MKKVITVAIFMVLTLSIEARTFAEAKAICEKGDAKMCMVLGDEMKKSNPKEANKYYAKGLKMVKKSCSKKNADACFSLASFYAFGKGVKKNEKKAVSTWKKALSLYEKSCKKGDSHSCNQAEHSQAMIEMAQ